MTAGQQAEKAAGSQAKQPAKKRGQEDHQDSGEEDRQQVGEEGDQQEDGGYQEDRGPQVGLTRESEPAPRCCAEP